MHVEYVEQFVKLVLAGLKESLLETPKLLSKQPNGSHAQPSDALVSLRLSVVAAAEQAARLTTG